MAMCTRPFLRRPARQRRGGWLRQNTSRPVEPLEPRTLLAFGAIGQEVRVDSDANTFADRPAVAADADGDSVVIWRDFDGGVGGAKLAKRQFMSNGAAVGGTSYVDTE